MNRTPMLARLSMETRPLHAELDDQWLDLLVPHPSRVQYIEQLVRVLGFESAVEAALAYTPGLGGSIVLRDWVRSSFAAKDLMSLGLAARTVARLPQCLVAPFADATEALGWMYVLERATLLHDGIRKHIETCFTSLPYVCTYLAANEGKHVARWNEFGEILERAVSRDPGAPEKLVRAALEACRRAIDWFNDGSQAVASWQTAAKRAG